MHNKVTAQQAKSMMEILKDQSIDLDTAAIRAGVELDENWKESLRPYVLETALRARSMGDGWEQIARALWLTWRWEISPHDLAAIAFDKLRYEQTTLQERGDVARALAQRRLDALLRPAMTAATSGVFDKDASMIALKIINAQVQLGDPSFGLPSGEPMMDGGLSPNVTFVGKFLRGEE